MACIEISAENITAPHLGIEATHICSVSEGDKGVPAEFSFRASGGKSIKDGPARIKRLKGNSVVWNQLSTTTELNQSHTSESLPIGASIVQGHKYAIILESSDARLYLYTRVDGSNKIISSTQNGKSWIFTSNYSATSTGTTNTGLWWFTLPLNNGITEYSAKNIRLTDLTQMFGAGNEPTTIEEYYARKPIVEDEFAYNEGEVIHMTAEGIKSVGDNAWDEEWRTGFYVSSTGEYAYRANNICNLNPFRILPNEEYWVNVNTEAYFFCYDENMQFIKYLYAYHPSKILTPANAAYMNFYCSEAYGTTYNHDIMITLVHSGWKQDTDAGYQPYWEDRLIFDQRIKDEFPDGMKSAGTAYDVAYNDMNKGVGVTEKRIGVVKMKDLKNWNYNASYGFHALVPSDMVVGNLNYLIKRPYTKFANPDRVTWEGLDKSVTNGLATIGTSWIRFLVIKDSAYTDVASFVASLTDDDILCYQLAEPTIIEYDEPFNLDYRVADFGTEQMLTERPSAPISADIAYVFNL